MKKAVFITAMDRVDYFAETLQTWESVRGIEDWHVLVRIEPSPVQDKIAQLAKESSMNVHINPEVYGVLPHPWLGFERLFEEGYDFVVRAEDDLLVSDDILEYFDAMAENYKDRQDVVVVLAFNPVASDDSDSTVRLDGEFNPWVWGTWSDRWQNVLRTNWDFAYSTYNGWPGNEAGWDWNFKTRVFPAHGLKCVQPSHSLVQNIGVWGVHGSPDNFQPAESWEQHHEQTNVWTER